MQFAPDKISRDNAVEITAGQTLAAISGQFQVKTHEQPLDSSGHVRRGGRPSLLIG
jgi:hypothetical protein